jgi:uncharacterized membrane protein YeaQ/YmgE (transglycosylase-associated protein family)
MALEQLIVWLIVGGLVGILADMFVSGIGLDLIEAIVVGILGALIGGWLFGTFGINLGSGLVSDIFTSLVGAILLLFVIRAIRR